MKTACNNTSGFLCAKECEITYFRNSEALFIFCLTLEKDLFKISRYDRDIKKRGGFDDA